MCMDVSCTLGDVWITACLCVCVCVCVCVRVCVYIYITHLPLPFMCMQSKKSAAAAPKKSMSADEKAEIAKFDAWVRLESGERERER